MATKTKKISVAELENIVKDTHSTNFIATKWNDVEIMIRPTIGLADMMAFVYEVVNGCFVGEGSEYTPELLDFFIRCEVLERYANFRLPRDVHKRYELVYGCDAFRFVLERINGEQFEIIMNAINDKIDATVQANISAVNRQISEIFATLNNLGLDVERVLGNLDEGTMNQLAGAIAGGKFDEQKLVDAIVAKRYGDEGAEIIDITEGGKDGD